MDFVVCSTSDNISSPLKARKVMSDDLVHIDIIKMINMKFLFLKKEIILAEENGRSRFSLGL